jgi:hypothetical protein
MLGSKCRCSNNLTSGDRIQHLMKSVEQIVPGTLVSVYSLLLYFWGRFNEPRRRDFKEPKRRSLTH